MQVIVKTGFRTDIGGMMVSYNQTGNPVEMPESIFKHLESTGWVEKVGVPVIQDVEEPEAVVSRSENMPDLKGPKMKKPGKNKQMADFENK